ncbi:hypothetical protein ACFQL1_10210 [Halomicroarcula sp. GCM10025709]|uniref:DUF7857 domain-containing protein n=1 Tax=Haloarcula TaxID=2237 RepID=UPI0024C3365A|nr:hypothetical protein [Halomicroarcula sp. YJ-61-S]
MASIECSWTHHEGVTLVTAGVTVAEEPTHVTVTNCLDGAVRPPRREGCPVPGWTDDGFAGVVDPGHHALGYAVEAPPADPPARLGAATPAPDAQPVGERTTPGAIVCDLGDPSPPADAVPAADIPDAPDSGVEPATAGAGVEGDDPPLATPGDLPSVVTDWLDAVERRLERREQSEAGRAVETDSSDEDGRPALPDERALRQLARRGDRLADRRRTLADPPGRVE